MGGIKTWNDNFINYLNDSKILSYDDLLLVHDDIIIINNSSNEKLYQNLHLIKNNNNKIYYVIHSIDSPNNIYFIKNYKQYDKCIVCSKQLKEMIEIKYNIETIFLPNYIKNDNIIINSISSDVFNLVFVGRISNEKNIPMILYAISFFNNFYKKDIQLKIYGNTMDITYMSYIQYLQTKLKLNNVYLMNHCDDKNEIYNNKDLLILPSVSEGMPYCVIEASNYGVPSLVTELLTTRELIKDDINGYLIKLECLQIDQELCCINYMDKLTKLGYNLINDKNMTDNLRHTCVYSDKKMIWKNTLICNVDIVGKTNNRCVACKSLINKTNIFNKNAMNIANKINEIMKKEKLIIKPLYSLIDYTKQLNLIDNKLKQVIDIRDEIFVNNNDIGDLIFFD